MVKTVDEKTKLAESLKTSQILKYKCHMGKVNHGMVLSKRNNLNRRVQGETVTA